MFWIERASSKQLKSLDKDRKCCYDKTARELERLLGKGDNTGAFTKVQKWYQK
jgi:hypothetical protein